METIQFVKRDTINLDALKANRRKLEAGLIAPAKEYIEDEIVKDHAAEPIKSMEDIDRISKYFISHRDYRDNMMFITGINFGLRVSDLRVLRFSNLINENFTFKDRFAVFERKTRNTRKRKKNRYITINDAVVEAVTLYLEHTPGVCLSDYMFKGSPDSTEPMARYSIERILKRVAKDLDLNIHVATHTLRKTFAYHMMLMAHNDPRQLLLLQKILNHSSPAQTLDYIGITAEEIDAAYKELNLGSGRNYLANASIIEFETKVV